MHLNYFVQILLSIIICIPVSLFNFYIMCGRGISRAEKIYMKFRVPLREGYPKEYFKQNKFIKFIRKQLKLSTYDTLHYSILILHYIQFVILCTPFCLCLFGFSMFESQGVYILVITFGIIIFEIILNIYVMVKKADVVK